MQQFFPATRPLFFYLFVFILRIKSIGELIFLCFAFLFYHSRACLHDIGWRHVHRFYYLRCFYYLCWFYYIIDLLWQHGTTYTQQNLSFFGKSVQVWTIYLKNGGSSWLPVFFNGILNNLSSDRSCFLRNQWYSLSIKPVYFSTFILQQKYLGFLPLLKRNFRTF